MNLASFPDTTKHTFYMHLYIHVNILILALYLGRFQLTFRVVDCLFPLTNKTLSLSLSLSVLVLSGRGRWVQAWSGQQ